MFRERQEKGGIFRTDDIFFPGVFKISFGNGGA